jgi:hypothetical protein
MDSRGVLFTEELQTNAGLDPVQDRYKTGYIACIKDLLNVDIETQEETQ